METNNIPKIETEWLDGITMTSEQKAKWLAALRSGEYKQVQGKLHENGSYCCLGVKAAAVDGIEQPRGLYLRDGSMSEQLQDVLVELNDNIKFSFPQIANYIEANIPACDEVRS